MVETILAQIGRRLAQQARRDHIAIALASSLLSCALAIWLADRGHVRSASWLIGAVMCAVSLWLIYRWLGQRLGLHGSLYGSPWEWLRPARHIPQQQRHRALHHLAQAAEKVAPEWTLALRSAVDLELRLHLGDQGFSHPLAQAHLTATAAALGREDFAERRRQQHPRRRPMLRAGLAIAATTALVAALALPTGRARLLARLLGSGPIRTSAQPLVGDIRLEYRFPAYTGLAPRIVEGSDGALQALAGTRVELEAVVDFAVEKAELQLHDGAADSTTWLPLQVVEGRQIKGSLALLHDGSYRFVLTGLDGDRVQEAQAHPVRVMVDTYPEVQLDEPAADVELREGQSVTLRWQARDDFAVTEVFLFIQTAPDAPPERLALATSEAAASRRSGTYQWPAAALLTGNTRAVSFSIEAVDNDSVSGPKRSLSSPRRLSLFDARRNHEELVAKQQECLDRLVDWLAADLTTPLAPSRTNAQAGALARSTLLHGANATLEKINAANVLLAQLITAMQADTLAKAAVVQAFQNIAHHGADALQSRRTGLAQLQASTAPTPAQWTPLAELQTRQIALLEKDIIYLDDLLAVAQIAELKESAKDLLSAQRSLQALLEKLRTNQDPTAAAQLSAQVSALRQKMMELLNHMGQIKKALPGEYRNIEAASMLRLEDEFNRLERLLEQGDLDAAGREIEQLANQIDDMMRSLDNAQQEYGGERYAAIRQQLADFTAQYRRVEREQQALAQRATTLLQQYRERAVGPVAATLDHFVGKARQLAAQALSHLDKAATPPAVAQLGADALNQARQALRDIDALLATHNFAEARNTGLAAEGDTEALGRLWREAAQVQEKILAASLAEAARASSRAGGQIRALNDMLEKLFPEPRAVLSPPQLADMQSITHKQQAVQEQSAQLDDKMRALAQEVPLFGGEPATLLEAAMQQMQEAVDNFSASDLPGATSNARQAAERMAQLGSKLEEAAKAGRGGGLPMPWGAPQPHNGGQGASDAATRDVEIPRTDANRAAPAYRQELLDAAKQKPPTRYEEAVRWYYDQLLH